MILADSGFWLAFHNARDRHHNRAVRAMRRYADEGLMTTWPVLSETCHLLGKWTHPDVVIRFVAAIDQGMSAVARIEFDALARIQRLMTKYRDLPMDLADASLVMLAEDLGDGRILSTDQRDFQTYRWKNTEPFQNLLLPE